jgi:hypothetical protein
MFSCQVCDKSFKRISVLRNHFQSATHRNKLSSSNQPNNPPYNPPSDTCDGVKQMSDIILDDLTNNRLQLSEQSNQVINN